MDFRRFSRSTVAFVGTGREFLINSLLRQLDVRRRPTRLDNERPSQFEVSTLLPLRSTINSLLRTFGSNVGV